MNSGSHFGSTSALMASIMTQPPREEAAPLPKFPTPKKSASRGSINAASVQPPQPAPEVEQPSEPKNTSPLTADAEAKYRRMKKMGLPDGAIKHKMMQDGFSERDSCSF